MVWKIASFVIFSFRCKSKSVFSEEGTSITQTAHSMDTASCQTRISFRLLNRLILEVMLGFDPCMSTCS